MDELGQKIDDESEATQMLLKREERLVCEQLAAGQPPYSQRAQSLLAIDEGATHNAAAQQSGQTVGQVRYWLGKFRKSRMSIFPEELLHQSEQVVPPHQAETDQPPGPESLDLDQPVKQDAAGKKSNRSTEEGKKKQDKKGKKKAKEVETPKKKAKKANKKKTKRSNKGKKKQDKKGKKKQNKQKKSWGKTGKKKKKG